MYEKQTHNLTGAGEAGGEEVPNESFVESGEVGETQGRGGRQRVQGRGDERHGVHHTASYAPHVHTLLSFTHTQEPMPC